MRKEKKNQNKKKNECKGTKIGLIMVIQSKEYKGKNNTIAM